MLAAGLHGLRRAAIVIPVAWTGVWIGYYAYTDTLRRSHIRQRNKELTESLSKLPGGEVDYTKPACELEKAAIKKRFASLKYAGRYWNPYIEWREQGAWEWAFWKLFVSTITLKLFYNGGVPPERPIPDLPIETPNFKLLFGSTFSRPSSPSSTAEKGLSNGNAHIHEPASNGNGAEDVDVTDKMTLTWLGQSTSYVTMDNLAILTDPALSHRTLESSLAPERLRPPPCTLSDLKKIDVVLVSHNHFDHLDPVAIKELGDRCEWIVPIGVGDFIREHGVTRVTELDWWEEKNHTIQRTGQKDKSFTITAIPVMHWSGRSPLNTNASQWSAFHVKTNTPDTSLSGSGRPRSFIHLGDTGYSPTLFSAVGRVLGPIDLAAIPIGSYEPQWHLHLHHTDPEGAVRMAMQMHVNKAIAVHHGTWQMSDEAYNKPPIDLALAKKKLEMDDERFSVIPVGRTIVVE